MQRVVLYAQVLLTFMRMFISMQRHWELILMKLVSKEELQQLLMVVAQVPWHLRGLENIFANLLKQGYLHCYTLPAMD